MASWLSLRFLCVCLLSTSSLCFGEARSPILPDVQAAARSIYGLKPSPSLVVYVTGGGVQLVPSLLATPGASNSVLDVQIPYSRAALVELLGKEPASYCSAEVAHDLAAAAYQRALLLAKKEHASDSDVYDGGGTSSRQHAIVGLGCTAALRSVPMNRGEHRCYVAVRTARGTRELALTLTKGARSRELEDAVVSRVALAALAHACGVGDAPCPEDAASFWCLDADECDVENGESVSDEQLEVSFRQPD
jgi:hypothetical protein